MHHDPANSHLPRLWPSGLFGLAVALLVVGSPTGSDLLANLDLLAVGDLDIDESIVALGPDLPRRAPLGVFWALLSPPLEAATATRLWMIVVVAVAAAGMSRHLRDIAAPLRFAGAAVFAVSPFLLTRLSVGHLGFASAVALLPWTIDTLLAPLENPRRTFRTLVMFGLCGYFGVLIVAPALAVGLASQRRLPTTAQMFWVVFSQTPWLAPALATIGSVGGVDSSNAFQSDVRNLADVLRLPLGFGFWRPPNQLGAENAASSLAGALMFLICLAGARWSPYRHRLGLLTLGAGGVLFTVASRLPWVSSVYDSLTGLLVLAPFREGHRLLAFAVFAAVALGARGLDAVLVGRSVRVVSMAAMALASLVFVSAPALGGLAGAARGYDTPAAWVDASERIEAQGGVVLALPFTRYFDLAAAGGRRAHNPIPILLDGDVIYSHDLGLGGRDVGLDDREPLALTLVRSLRFGEPIDDQVDALGLRWVVALSDIDGGRDIELLRLAGFAAVIDTPDITVFAVDGEPADTQELWSFAATIIVFTDFIWLLVVAGAVWGARARSRQEWRGS